MEDGEIDDSEINPVGETLIMEMAKRIEDHNAGVNMDNIDRMIVDKTLCVIGCNELHTKEGCPAKKYFLSEFPGFEVNFWSIFARFRPF